MKKKISEGHEILSLKDESEPLLKNRFLDKFTRVKWYVPLLIYIPIILYFLQRAFGQLSFLGIVITFLLGIVIWSITEYIFHRFVFHFVPKNNLEKQIHFILHGVHHAYPNDSLRLVMPPVLSIPLSGTFCLLFYFLFGKLYTATFAGFMSAYLVYDMLHYAVHHLSAPKLKWFNTKKIRHMKHHYLHSESEFSVTFPYWDRVFNTNFRKGDGTIVK